MLGIDTDKISEMVTEHVERAMAPMLDEMGQIKDLLARLVEIEEGRETPRSRRRDAIREVVG